MTIVSLKPANALPINFSPQAVPFDAAASFALGATLSASAFASGAQASPIAWGPGRMQGNLMLNVSSANGITPGTTGAPGGTQSYQFFLLGSYDPAFASGNLDILAMYDIAGTSAARDLPTFAGASPAIPDVGLSAAQFVIPFSNQRDVNTFPFLNLFVQIAGTTPSITFSAWAAPWTGQKS
jgi:hypothetical protein